MPFRVEDRTVSSKSPGVVYFACLSGRSYLFWREVNSQRNDAVIFVSVNARAYFYRVQDGKEPRQAL